MRERITPPWALILAGGDSTWSRPLPAHIAGDARPQQFCRPEPSGHYVSDDAVFMSHATSAVERSHRGRPCRVVRLAEAG